MECQRDPKHGCRFLNAVPRFRWSSFGRGGTASPSSLTANLGAFTLTEDQKKKINVSKLWAEKWFARISEWPWIQRPEWEPPIPLTEDVI